MKQLTHGTLITLEGVDGSGKTTLAAKLARLLKDEFELVVTKEPGDTSFGKNLRAVVQKQQTPLEPKAEFLLFAADRAQHVREVLQPALRTKKLVLCDRMADSSLVYQGHGRGLSTTVIQQVNEWVLDGIKPFITLYVRLTPEHAYQRLLQRGTKLTAFFDADDYSARDWQALMQITFTAYEQLYAGRSDVCILDATQAPEIIATQAHEFIIKALTNAHRIA